MSVAERTWTGTTDVGGRRLAWRALGSGPSLLLLNGYAATAMDWDPRFLRTLARSFTVVCPDHRGIGASEPGDPDEPLTVDAMARDAESLLDALELERAPVVGWSMGGFVAQRLAVRAPGRVAALGLLSTNPGGAAAVRADPAVWMRLIDHSGTPREQASRLIALLFPPPLAAQIDGVFGEQVAAARAALSPSVLAAQEAAMAAWHAEEQPRAGAGGGAAANADSAAHHPPVLVAHGTEDVVIPPANADALAARWPGARVERFAGGGHAFMAQEPARLGELIAGFVAG